MPDPDSIVRPITATLRWLVIATVVLYIAIGGLALWNYTRAASIEDSLCTLRADLERRVETSENFLRENPEGIPGISVETIQTGIANQRSTIEALSSLNCDALT